MKKLTKPRKDEPNFSWDVDSPQKTARLRMVRLPIDESRDLSKQALFPRDDYWVPVSVVNGNIYILPGVPRLCKSSLVLLYTIMMYTSANGMPVQGLLEGLKPFILDRLVDPEGKGIIRILISTPKAESAVASYLTELAEKVAPKGVKVGSYPRWGKSNNSVTLVGRDKEYLESLVPEVLAAVDGKRITKEGEEDESAPVASEQD